MMELTYDMIMKNLSRKGELNLQIEGLEVMTTGKNVPADMIIFYLIEAIITNSEILEHDNIQDKSKIDWLEIAIELLSDERDRVAERISND